MTVTRRNILAGDADRDAFVAGVLALKAERLGPTTADFGLPGPPVPVSTYDLFVLWHHVAMMRMTPPGQLDRNSAHSGPAFLPWHRHMLMLFELQLQRVLDDDDVALPYWDWTAPGEGADGPLWSAAVLGGTGRPVTDGPFRAGRFAVRVESGATARLRVTDRPLRRALGAHPAAPSLPTREQLETALQDDVYDRPAWNSTSASFRNRLEGWNPPLQLHNRVHVWVGGDMAPATSPNDPVFYLNHANVDRVWETWQDRHGRRYDPPADASPDLAGHRLDDPLYSILTTGTTTPADVLDVSSTYVYDRPA
jgi:tyrosinase